MLYQIYQYFFSLSQIGIESFAWNEILTIAPVVGALGLWVFYLIKQNDHMSSLLTKERDERNEERKEMNEVVKEMTDIVDRAYSAIESGNILTVQTIKNETEHIKIKLQALSDKIDMHNK